MRGEAEKKELSRVKEYFFCHKERGLYNLKTNGFEQIIDTKKTCWKTYMNI